MTDYMNPDTRPRTVEDAFRMLRTIDRLRETAERFREECLDAILAHQRGEPLPRIRDPHKRGPE